MASSMGAPSLSLLPGSGPAAAPGAARSHAVINALIEELPAPGGDFPAAARQAWLDLMCTAFTLAYGPADGAAMPQRTQAAAAARRRKGPPAKPTPLGPTGPRFYVDGQNIARAAGGARIMPADVIDELVDLRGMNGDLATITWADGSTGIPKGVQLNVTIG